MYFGGQTGNAPWLYTVVSCLLACMSPVAILSFIFTSPVIQLIYSILSVVAVAVTQYCIESKSLCKPFQKFIFLLF